MASASNSLEIIKMKYTVYLFGSALLLALICFATVSWLQNETIGVAQVVRDDKHILDAKNSITDATITDEMIAKAHSEADLIHETIIRAIKSGKPQLKLSRSNMPSPRVYYSRENLGRTLNEISWQDNRTRISMDLQLGHNKTDTLDRFRLGLEGISMGEFFKAPGIGDEAVLVKNVDFNKKVTSVGLHFVKGRAKVSVYVKNFSRSTEKNEKELMEIVRIIEPLVVARADIRDL